MTNLKIYLIQPTAKNFAGFGCMPGLTLPYLAALTPEKYEVKITDESVEKIDYKYGDLIGITFLTYQADKAYAISRKFRSRGKKVIFGGVHATFCEEEVLEHCDALVAGTVEEIWPTVIFDFENNDLKRIYKGGDIPDPKKMAIPRYDLIEIEKYRLKWFPIRATLGCPLNCSFCCVPALSNRKYVKRPIKDIIRDIKAINYHKIFFVDDNIAVDEIWAMELFNEVEKLGIEWGGQCNVNIAANRKLLEKAKKSGCTFLLNGIESLSESQLNEIGKTANTPEKYTDYFKNLSEVGIAAHASAIVGFAEDDLDTFGNFFNFFMDNGIPLAYFFILTPLPGTDIYKELNAQKRIQSYDWSKYDFSNILFYHSKMSNDQIYSNYRKVCRELYSFRNILKRLKKIKDVNLKWRLFKLNLYYRRKLNSFLPFFH